ncbi:MAG TPA: hypothetical protein PKC43_02420 [Phycisphaerales bacterium]|nr:hypothetical protein [Phycisphaerales bacterium]HMP36280.1 hypothetical protein [Phycisphaerales bacterium]
MNSPTSTKAPRHSSATAPVAVGVGLAALALLTLINGSTAQVQVGSGRALDANLQLGMGGYNSAVGQRFTLRQPAYLPSRAIQPWFGGGPGLEVARQAGEWGDPLTRYQTWYAFLADRGYSPIREGTGSIGFTGVPQGGGWITGGSSDPGFADGAAGAVPVDLRAR